MNQEIGGENQEKPGGEPNPKTPPSNGDDNKHSSTNEQPRQNNDDKTKEPFLKLSHAEWFLVVFNITTIVIMSFQSHYMSGQLDEMKVASKIADEGIKQGRLALEATIAAQRLDQRAWVGAKDVTVSHPEAGKPFRAQFHYINSGRTFALKLTAKWVYVFGKPESEQHLIDEAERKMATLTATNIGATAPGVGFNVTVENKEPFTQQDLRDITGGKTFIYVVVNIVYDDMFQTPHFTHIFGRYNPSENSFSPGSIYNDAN